MRTFLGFLLGGLIAGAVALGVGILAMDQGWVSTREGAAAMGIAFFITPTAALFGAIAGAIIARATRRRQP